MSKSKRSGKPEGNMKRFNLSLEELREKNVIYKMEFPCGCTYVGKTVRRLGMRLSGHFYDANRFSKDSSKNRLVPKLLEALSNEHIIKVEILERCEDPIRLGELEKQHIQRFSDANLSLNARLG